jgi:class 3 adenylate cyclase
MPSSVSSPEKRRLAAIVFTDVVSYSARMQRDETGTIKRVAADFETLRERCEKHHGEVLNSMGDGLLLCFGSADDAVACAVELQHEFGERRKALPPEEALEHRMGIHIGDVFRQETGGITGDGVNIAARLEGKAPLGGVCISQMVYDTVNGKIPLQAVFAGAQSFKNITEPIKVWHVASADGPATEADVASCDQLCERVHGHNRHHELLGALEQQSVTVVERDGRIAGYSTGIGFFGHTVAESNDDLKALIAAAPEIAGPGLLLPTRNGEVFRWCLSQGLRVTQPMTLMSHGLYNVLKGAFLPTVLY